MRPAESVTVAVVFVWLGMVAAISFLEAPLKFRAPDVTLRIGLGIGRVVFRALNAVEVVFATVVLVGVVADRPPAYVTGTLAAAIAVLTVQLALLRPRLTQRSDQVLAGLDGPRSRIHLVYIALELIKVVALLSGGTLLLGR